MTSWRRAAVACALIALVGAATTTCGQRHHRLGRRVIVIGLDGLDYGLTHSCYDPLPDGRPCGRCDSCRLRARGFAEAGAADPVGATSTP